MQLRSVKVAIATLWISAVWAAGIAGNVDSLPHWTLLVSVGVLPPLVMWSYWNVPGPTTSEAIRDVLR